MCGRYTITNVKDLDERFHLMQQDFEGLMPRYNIAPGQVLPVVLNESPADANVAIEMKWGLVPYWSKDGTGGYRMINARAEGIAQKPAFRKPIRSQRCLVPASGFYEWQKQGRVKVPFYFHLPDEELFAFAGLYDIWRDPEGKQLKTYTIITTAANEIVAPIHERMPVILRREDEAAWVDPDNSDLDQLTAMLAPYPAAEMEAYRVSTQVNTPNIDVRELLTRNSM